VAVPKPDRVKNIDVLRGFALLGILLVNVPAMAGPHLGPGGAPAVSPADEVAGWLLTALVSAKFYLLFSFLFGYSFTLQRAAAERAGAPFAPRHLRRSAGLFLLGLAHAVLLFPGDVLVVYAVLSLVLFAVRDITPRTAVRAAACLITGVAVCLLVWGLATVVLSEPVPAREVTASVHERATSYRGDVGSVIRANTDWWRRVLGWNVLYGAPAVWPW
jgi:uncharacterized protein